MLGLGANMMKHPITGKSIVRDSLVLQHNYNVSPVQLISSGTAFFDGTNDYINIGDIGAIKSLAFWFNPSISISSSTSYQRMFAFNSSYHGVSLGASTGSISGEVIAVLPDAVSRTGATTPLTANTWYHGCISWNASNNNFDIYIDGVLSNNLTAGTHTLTNWDSFIIGTDNGVGTHFGGLICNVGVWSETLSQPQIKSIMQKDYAGLSDSEKTDLVSWWNLDSVIDSAVYANSSGSTSVYDNHHGSGGTLGANIVTGYDLGSSFSEWAVYDPNANGATISTDGSIITVNVKDGDNGDNQGAKCELSSSLVSGKTYELTADLWLGTYVPDPTGEFVIYLAGQGIASTLTTTRTTYTRYITATNTSDLIFHQSDADENEGTFFISNVSVKLVNGNTGTLS